MVLVGMNEETVINQQAQEHAVACALFARLFGQLTPSFMRLPILNKNLDQPTKRLALDNIKCAPTQAKRFVVAIKYEKEETYRYLIASDLSWRTLDIVQPTKRLAL